MTAILLLIALLASLASLISTAIFFLQGDSRRAARLLVRWTICAASYLAILLVVALLPRDGELGAAPYCDDDWCMTVESVTRTPTPAGVSCKLALRLSSRALHGPRSARGAWAYLTDRQGRRFSPVPDPSVAPLDITLRPGESIPTTLAFNLPPDARQISFIGGLEGIHYASFVLGNGDLLNRPRITFRIPD